MKSTDLFTVLVGHDGSTRRSSIGTETDSLFFPRIAAPELDADDGRSRRGRYQSSSIFVSHDYEGEDRKKAIVMYLWADRPFERLGIDSSHDY